MSVVGQNSRAILRQEDLGLNAPAGLRSIPVSRSRPVFLTAGVKKSAVTRFSVGITLW